MSPAPPPVYKPMVLYAGCSFYCLNAEEQQRDTIKTSLLSVILIHLLNLLLNSALLFFGTLKFVNAWNFDSTS